MGQSGCYDLLSLRQPQGWRQAEADCLISTGKGDKANKSTNCFPLKLLGGRAKLGVLFNSTQLHTNLEMNDRFHFLKRNINKKVYLFVYLFIFDTKSKEIQVPVLGN